MGKDVASIVQGEETEHGLGGLLKLGDVLEGYGDAEGLRGEGGVVFCDVHGDVGGGDVERAGEHKDLFRGSVVQIATVLLN